jgi:hypothetical protein
VLVLIIAIIEFALTFNALLAINFATREAALIGAEAGNDDNADCMILHTVDKSITPPTDDGQITEVRIYRAHPATGQPSGGAINVYARGGGSLSCDLPDGGTATVPYRLVSEAYPEATRCNVLAGCGGSPLDHIGVQVTYQYLPHTPLANLTNVGGSGYTMVKSNAMRMEPIL